MDISPLKPASGQVMEAEAMRGKITQAPWTSLQVPPSFIVSLAAPVRLADQGDILGRPETCRRREALSGSGQIMTLGGWHRSG